MCSFDHCGRPQGHESCYLANLFGGAIVIHPGSERDNTSAGSSPLYDVRTFGVHDPTPAHEGAANSAPLSTTFVKAVAGKDHTIHARACRCPLLDVVVEPRCHGTSPNPLPSPLPPFSLCADAVPPTAAALYSRASFVASYVDGDEAGAWHWLGAGLREDEHAPHRALVDRYFGGNSVGVFCCCCCWRAGVCIRLDQ